MRGVSDALEFRADAGPDRVWHPLPRYLGKVVTKGRTIPGESVGCEPCLVGIVKV